VTGSQQDTTRGLPLADHVAGGGRAQDSILTDDQLLHAVRSADPGDQLNDLGVVEAAITTNDQESALCTLGDGEEDASDEGLGVVGLLEDGDLLAKTGTEESQSAGTTHCRQYIPQMDWNHGTHVPGFWSVKGVIETVWIDIVVEVAAGTG